MFLLGHYTFVSINAISRIKVKVKYDMESVLLEINKKYYFTR